MKLKEDYWELEFKYKERYSDHADMWSTDMDYKGKSFTVSVLENRTTHFDKDGLKSVLNAIFEQFEHLLDLADGLSIALNKRVFGTQFDTHDSAFDLSGIEIQGFGNVGNSSHIKWAHINFDLHLIDTTNFLSDPFVTYETSFHLEGKRITPKGITRI